jgi:hypothetical protein
MEQLIASRLDELMVSQSIHAMDSCNGLAEYVEDTSKNFNICRRSSCEKEQNP